MQVQKTIKFKVGELGKRKQGRLDFVLNNGLSATKEFLRLALENKTTSNIKLHRLGYFEIVKKYNLPACIVHQARNKAREVYKSWKTNKFRLREEIKLPKLKSLRVRFDNVIFQLIETDNKKYPYFVSFLCERGRSGKQDNRIYVPIIANSEWQKEYIFGLISKKYKKGSADLVKKGEDYFVHIVIGKEIYIPQLNSSFNPIGIDCGINNLAVVNVSGKPKFFSGGEVLWKKQNYGRIKSILQNKKATKKLRQICKKEKNFVDNINHQISSWVIREAKKVINPVIVLEDLKYIRETTKVRKKQRYAHNSWAFKQLQNTIRYKAYWEEIPVIFIDSRYTSQICPKCLSVNKRQKHNYKCSYCGYQANSDFIASINIQKRFLEAISFPENSTHKSAERDDLLMFNNSPKICELNLRVSPPKPKAEAEDYNSVKVLGIQNTNIL